MKIAFYRLKLHKIPLIVHCKNYGITSTNFFLIKPVIQLYSLKISLQYQRTNQRDPIIQFIHSTFHNLLNTHIIYSFRDTTNNLASSLNTNLKQSCFMHFVSVFDFLQIFEELSSYFEFHLMMLCKKIISIDVMHISSSL